MHESLKPRVGSCGGRFDLPSEQQHFKNAVEIVASHVVFRILCKHPESVARDHQTFDLQNEGSLQYFTSAEYNTIPMSSTPLTGMRHRRIPSAKMPSTRNHLSNRILSGAEDHRVSSGRDRAITQLAGVKLSNQEADAILQELANHDENSKKTWSRLLVERYLSKYAWYFPGKDTPNGPSLSKAWAFYEHVTLPRHYVGDGSADTVWRRAEPGEFEAETELYDWLKLKQSHLIEWGTGVDLYFISLRFFAVLMLVCGIINLPAIMYYAGDEYNNNAPLDYDLALRGSAVCNSTAWVVCTDCKKDQWKADLTRFAIAQFGGNETFLVKRNLCAGASREIAYVNFVTAIVVIAAVGIFYLYLKAREVRFDEDKATTTDYSVVVHNPPPDAIDPEKWRSFFTQFATDGDQVTVVTVALNNQDLVRKLVVRRIFMNQLMAKLVDDLDLDDETAVYSAIMKYNEEKAAQEPNCISRLLDWVVIPLCNLINLLLPPEELVKKIKKLTEEIKELQEKKYDATSIFVTFETEEGQRTALHALQVGLIDLKLNRTHAVPPECLFEGRVLDVKQPTDPTSVRWMNLAYTYWEKLIRRAILLGITLGMIAVAGFTIQAARVRYGPSIAGFLTTTFNSIIPQVIKILMIMEPHSTEGEFQSSLYLKITIFRWTLSAILVQIITPFTATLGPDNTDLLKTISAILLFDVWLGPLLRLSDWFTNLKKHILGPRARTQEEMNLSFQGTFYNFGERYTDFTKILFVVFFYSALFPPGFFFGFLILTFQYCVDKFSLVRIWSWNPSIGPELAIFSRQFFFTGAALTLCVVSVYAFAQFPYDNVCTPDDPESGFAGTYDATIFRRDTIGRWEQASTNITVTQDTNSVFCDQSWTAYNGFSFPPNSRIQTNGLSWMTEVQEDITWFYGWFAVAFTIAFFIAMFGGTLYVAVVSVFVGAFQPEGADQHIDFSSNPEIFAYVPQIKLTGQPYPYLVCDIDDIDEGLIGWSNPSHSYDYFNLIFDIPHKSLRRTVAIDLDDQATIVQINEQAQFERPIYSIIKHYPTRWQIELAEKEAANGNGTTSP